jgi:dTDP-4-amino-4,6-dideoxygalactose transaminase
MSSQSIPLAVPNIGAKEAEYVARCFRDNWVSTVGPFVDRLEAEVAKISGVPYGVAVAAGTMGLHAALDALGVGRGDLVIIPAYTFIASANAVSQTGARPWLFDIAADSWTLDPDALERALAQDCTQDAEGVLRLKVTGERIAAVMPVYTLGTPADMDRIVPLARRYGLPVVADAAAAIGAKYKGKPIGALAEVSVYSFNGNKTITSGGGGMVVGPGADLLKLIKHTTTTARVGTDYDHDRIGFNYRMTNIEAALGCAQAERLSEFLAAKKRIRQTYNTAFANHPRVTLFPDVSWADSTYWFSGLVLREDAEPCMGDIIQALRDANIMARKFWKPMHLQAPYGEVPKCAMPVTDSLWQRVLTLPCSTSLSESDQARVIAAVMRALT